MEEEEERVNLAGWTAWLRSALKLKILLINELLKPLMLPASDCSVYVVTIAQRTAGKQAEQSQSLALSYGAQGKTHL